MASLEEVFSQGVGAEPTMSAPEPEAPTSAQEAPTEPVQAAEEAAPEATTGDETSDATPASEDTEQPTQVPLAALKDERRKRQQLEKEVAQIRASLQTDQQAPVQQEEQVGFYDDPEAFVKNAQQQTQQYLSQALVQQRIALSQEMARQNHDDYDAMVEQFAEAVQASPGLAAQMQQASNPAEFAYKHGRLYKDTKDIGSIDEWRAKERAKLKSEVLAEIKKEQAETAAGSVPKSNAAIRGEGNVPGAKWQGPPTLESILPGVG